jgi:hypothetical protein
MAIFIPKKISEFASKTQHRVRSAYKISMPEVMRRYRIGNTFGTKAIQLVMPTTFTAKRLRLKPWHNPYTEKAVYFGTGESHIILS